MNSESSSDDVKAEAASPSAVKQPIVVIDASVFEERYLRVLLDDEVCRDISMLRDHGYAPVILERNLAELLLHAKLETGNASRWARSQHDYPGGLLASGQVAKAIRLADPNADVAQTARLWFNLCEEWSDGPWDTWPQGDGTTGRYLFVQWKVAMARFCRRVIDVIASAGVITISPWAVLQTALARQSAYSLEQEMM